MKTNHRPVEFDMDAVIQVMKEYCIRKGYDLDEIDRYSRAWDIVAAVKYKDIESDGLCNDIETLPDIVLYYDANGVIHETEHTERIRKKDAPGESFHGDSQDSAFA